mgnify:CR=1 FL=1
MCDDKYGSPLKPSISAFDLKIDGLTLDEQIKLNYIKENDDFVHAKTMRQQVILVSKALFGDDSRINYSTIAKIFKSNVNSVKRHINSSINSNKNGRHSIFPEVQKNLLFRLFMFSFKRKIQSTTIFYKKPYGSIITLQYFQIH